MIPLLLLPMTSLGCKNDDRPPPLEDQNGRIPNPNVPHDRLPEQSAAFTETECRYRVPGFVTQCGEVAIPGSPGTDRELRIAVARVFTSTTPVKDDPIVYLDGGPGGPSLPSIEYLYPAMRDIAPDRDFVYIDQRGVGLSNPNLQCTEGGEVLSSLDRCYERLSETVDLDNFNSITNANDIDLIRQAFGYEQWNLLGISYGTRLALTVMRDHPEGVRSALIDSVVPLQADLLGEIGRNGYRAFERTFAACAADPACATAYPDSMSQLIAIAESLNAEPAAIGNTQLTGDDFVGLAFQLLYSPDTIALVPKLIDDVYNGDFSLFDQLGTASASGPGISFGMHLCLHCAEEVPFTSEESFDALDAQVPEELRTALTGRDYLDYCAHWPVARAADSENEPVESALPALVMAGWFDPITPPEFAEAAHMFLSNADYFMVENDSHGASLGECGLAIGRAFFDSPGTTPPSDCLDSLIDIGFETRGLSPGGPRGIDFAVGDVPPEKVDHAKDQLRLRLR